MLLFVEYQVKSLTAVEREARVARNERQVLGDGMGDKDVRVKEVTHGLQQEFRVVHYQAAF